VQKIYFDKIKIMQIIERKILFLIYAVLIVLSCFSFKVGAYIPFFLAFSFFIGWLYFTKKESGEGGGDFKISRWLIIIPIIFILISRILPFFFAEAPLGYDTGIYKKSIENFARALPELPQFSSENAWDMRQPWGLCLSTNLFSLIGFSEIQVFYGYYIFLSLFLGGAVYAIVKRFFNQNAAILAFFVFALSLTQFQTFFMVYYKNIASLFLMLIGFYLLKEKSWLVIPVAGFLGGLHRPTFYIFGLAMFAHFIFNKNKKYHLVSGILILLVAASLYAHNPQAIYQFLSPDLGETIKTFGPGGGGTFFDFEFYRKLIVFYLPFAVLGLIGLIKKKRFDYLFFWFIFNFLIVFLGLLFYNRFIIPLDIIVIILSGVTFSQILAKIWERREGKASLAVLMIGAVYLFVVFFQYAQPLISDEELTEIKSLEHIAGEDEYVMATDSFYSPWVYGFSERKTIAPGLFEYDQWNREEWWGFWTTKDPDVWDLLLDRYKKPVYLFLGDKQHQIDFSSNARFEKISKRIWKYE